MRKKLIDRTKKDMKEAIDKSKNDVKEPNKANNKMDIKLDSKLKKESKPKKAVPFIPFPNCNECLIEAERHKADWEVMLNVMCPKINRPRRTSLHTLGYVLGRTDLLELAKEMQ